MAKVTGPLFSAEARGRVGSLVYNTWRGIAYVKSTKTPATEYSPDQIAIRLLTANATIAWKAASDAERAAWHVYADDHPDQDWRGSPKRITAYNWFVRINVRCQLVGSAVSTIVPAHQVADVVAGLTLFGPSTNAVVQWTSGVDYDPPDLYYEFYSAGPHSHGASPSVKLAKRLDHVPAGDLGHAFNFGPPGFYSLWARPIHMNGTVAGWTKVQADLA